MAEQRWYSYKIYDDVGHEALAFFDDAVRHQINDPVVTRNPVLKKLARDFKHTRASRFYKKIFLTNNAALLRCLCCVVDRGVNGPGWAPGRPDFLPFSHSNLGISQPIYQSAKELFIIVLLMLRRTRSPSVGPASTVVRRVSDWQARAAGRRCHGWGPNQIQV
jgi:hypothetical protein